LRIKLLKNIQPRAKTCLDLLLRSLIQSDFSGRLPMEISPTPIITLTTDFISDLYRGQMKGVILSINKKVQIIDIGHHTRHYDILEGAFLIWQVCCRFPPGSIHVGVIDPGVGTSRAGLAIKTDRFYFIGPDNGLFSLALKDQSIKTIIQIDPSRFEKASSIFHGRDIFAPLAAYISLGKKIEDFGQRIDKVKPLKLKKDSIIYIDEFGNIITSTRKISPLAKKVTIHYKDRKIKSKFAQAFAEVKAGEFVVLRGSSGYLEIDKNQDSAAKDLGAKVGETVKIHPS
jgi:hypothetical protein